MKCEYCAGDTKPKLVSKYHWLQGRMYVIENVPAEVCQECGEKYFHAKVLDRIDEMIRQRHKVKEIMKVEVLDFEGQFEAA